MARPYHESRSSIEDGDVLLFESTGRVAGFIKRATRSRYSHAALAVWWGDTLMCVESREGKGVRAVRLSNVLRDTKAKVEHYKPLPWLGLDRQEVVRAALRKLGEPYGWLTILKHALAWVGVVVPKRLLANLPLVGGFLSGLNTYSYDDLEDPQTALVCSAFVAYCYSKGGGDLVRNLADAYTTPGDLSRSLGIALLQRLEL